ncbi:efflux RND transporter permease subunit [Terrarubrum flagellatum]|uniref:efflux RND transporter permease subunit n=1 Tax=Terrirubrum flagellatum TaxID=2895980 RepID=UPI003145685E
MARFFINRPIFAWVIAIVIMLGGALAITSLSIAQYPNIAPTTVRIQANYPGASAETIENSVTKVIEQNMTGLDHLQYMASSSTSSGNASITLTFTNDANPDTAQVQVQNKLSLVTSQLPQIVQSLGVTVTKANDSFLMVVALTSEDGSMSSNDLADYINSTLNDRIKRIDGVGGAQVFGGGYAMRIWLDPIKLAQYQLMPSDVTAAIVAQNVQVSAGQLGGLPSVNGNQLNATISAQSRLQTPEQFREIILKSDMRGSLVRIGDVARVELGADSYTSVARYNGKPAAGLAINLATGANAISTAQAVQAALKDMEAQLPTGVAISYPYDTTPFVRLSIEEVVRTLLEAIVLVFLVMYLFLQNFRATLIPTIAVPVVLLGTFGVLAAFGYSINTLTMFAMVLAIGLLVDDAIVVVENVERVMSEEGLSPREATLKSMDEITGALVGIATVLSAVFIPMAFFGGSVGVIYRQFSVTIVSAMVLSVLVALVLTPALCATMLKASPNHGAPRRGFFGWFNRMFGRATNGYISGVRGIVRLPAIFLVGFALIVGGVAWMFNKVPGSFIPDEDQGVLFTIVQLPTGATQDRGKRVLEAIRKHFSEKEKDAVDGVFDVAGFSFAGQGQNVGIAFIKLKEFAQRKSPNLRAAAVAQRANIAFFGIRDAMVFALAPPALPGVGNSSGFEMYLQDAGGAGHEKLMEARNQFLGLAARNPRLANTRPNGQEDTPQFAIEIDREKARAFALSLADVNNTLSIAWAGAYVNDFIDRGRVKSVYVQADAPFRMSPENLDDWQVRNATGGMVPFSAIASSRWTYGSPNLQRFNGVSAVQLQGQAAPGVSSGVAMDEAEALMKQLPQGFTRAWSGLSYQERLSGSQAGALYAISILVVFLCLAALYESWSIPFAVMLAVPLGVFGALLAAILASQSNDVYFKVGLLTTIGLAAKNAILIVEFAIEQQAQGKGVVEATLEACRQRLRPILMTSFAFILGVLPLALANGAGSGAQNAIGFGVLGGMLAATFLGVFFVPLLFVTVRRIFKGRTVAAAGGGAQAESATAH